MTNLGRFRDIIIEYDEICIDDYANTRKDSDPIDYRGLICVVASAKPIKCKGKIIKANAKHHLGSDGWIKVWPKDDDERIPSGKLWLYQPRATLIHRDNPIEDGFQPRSFYDSFYFEVPKC